MTVLNRQPDSKKQDSEHLLPFENIYSQYYTRVYRYFRAHLKNDDDAADLTQQVCQIAHFHGGVGGVRTERLLDNRQRLAQQRFSLSKFALLDQHRAEIVQGHPGIRMLRSERFLDDGQSLPIQGLGFAVAVQVAQDHGEAGGIVGSLRVVGPEVLQVAGERTPIQRRTRYSKVS